MSTVMDRPETITVPLAGWPLFGSLVGSPVGLPSRIARELVRKSARSDNASVGVRLGP